MYARRRGPTQNNRRCQGFTLIELLVVIVIITTLVALIFPAIQQARATARKNECLNNMRQVGTAVYNLATNKRGRFPAFGTFNGSAGSPVHMHSWIVETLPYLDRRDIYDRWDFTKMWDDQDTSAAVVLNRITIGVLSCPDDHSSAETGGFSYVINAGYAHLNPQEEWHNFDTEPVDWNGNGDMNEVTILRDPDDSLVHQRSGLTWAHFDGGKNRSHSIDTIYDGAGQTIMLVENVSAGVTASWANPLMRNIAFVFPVDTASGAPFLHTAQYFNAAPMDRLNDGSLNASRGGPEGLAYPTSEHIGSVNMVFCDGGARSINEDINLNVYARLVSPSGTKPGTPANVNRQDPLAEDF